LERSTAQLFFVSSQPCLNLPIPQLLWLDLPMTVSACADRD
jgi:hypothetical protein